jgi:hypothetical protein
MCIRNYMASQEEQRRPMAADTIVPTPIYAETRAITIDASVEHIWPWLAQMGSGRAGWYAFDWIDNGGRPSAKTILPEYQHIAPGDIMPALPGMRDVFLLTAVDPPRRLILTVPDVTFGSRVSWEFLVEPLDQGHSRLIVRGRVSPHWLDAVNRHDPAVSRGPIFIERVYGLLTRIPRPIMLAVASFGHGLMEVRQLRGIKRRAEA